jgi:hypothetical protein
MVAIKKIEFTADCHLEGSWGARPLGKLNCSMELFEQDGDTQIEFVAGDDVEHIGIYHDNKVIHDFDGVFDVPEQAIALLKSCGYNTKEIE